MSEIRWVRYNPTMEELKHEPKFAITKYTAKVGVKKLPIVIREMNGLCWVIRLDIKDRSGIIAEELELDNAMHLVDMMYRTGNL